MLLLDLGFCLEGRILKINELSNGRIDNHNYDWLLISSHNARELGNVRRTHELCYPFKSRLIVLRTQWLLFTKIMNSIVISEFQSLNSFAQFTESAEMESMKHMFSLKWKEISNVPDISKRLSSLWQNAASADSQRSHVHKSHISLISEWYLLSFSILKGFSSFARLVCLGDFFSHQEAFGSEDSKHTNMKLW